ncbi:hypothetical protein DPV78_006812 [Talaromyces pinophilus]|nr:hypothetical protein DPV78_006812 [Talaromyces pinophilus]
MANTLSGQCLCKAVTFTVQGDPENVFMCYCEHCQKNAGSIGQISAKFPREKVTIQTGQDMISTYILQDNISGHPKHKVFCKQCGCTLWTIPMRHGGSHLIVRTSLLEDGLRLLAPRMEFFVSKKPPGFEGSTKGFDTMPGF